MISRRSVERGLELRLINFKLAAARMRVNAKGKNKAALEELEQKLSRFTQMEAEAESRLTGLREASDECWEAERAEVECFWVALAKEVRVFDPGF